MNSIDIIILVILGIFCLKGFFRGIIVEVLTLVGLVVAYVIALREMSTVAGWIERVVHLPSLISTALGFFMIFLLIVLFFRWVAGAVRRITQWIFLGWIDRGGGMLFGIFKGALIVSLLILLISLVTFSKELEREQKNSLLFKPVSVVAPAVFTFIKHVFPRTKDYYEEVKEGLSNSSKEIVDRLYSRESESLLKELEDHVPKE